MTRAFAVGTLHKPRSIFLEGKAQADVRAYELEVTAGGLKRAMSILADSDQTLQRRAADRLWTVEVLRQKNIDFFGNITPS